MSLNKFMQLLMRRKKPVDFVDFRRVEPVSTVFGIDRGLPIDRYYIERFLAAHSDRIAGEVLEVGASTYTKRFGGSRVATAQALHVSPEPGQNCLVGNLTDRATLPDRRFDCFICTQTFNFIYDHEAAVRGAWQVLKPGGVLLATVAGISQVSRYDMDRWGDYWRFTTASLERLFAPVFETCRIESHGNPLAACAMLQGCAVEDLPEPSLLDDVDPDYQVLLTIVAERGAE